MEKEVIKELAKEKLTENYNKLLEELSNLEHEQWLHWSKAVIKQLHEGISPYETEKLRDRTMQLHQKWLKNWKPYDELDEETKEHDRVWARKVLDLLDLGQG